MQINSLIYDVAPSVAILIVTGHIDTIDRLPNECESFFYTPLHHRVYNGSNEYLDKNNGGKLIIKDKLFETKSRKDKLFYLIKPSG